MTAYRARALGRLVREALADLPVVAVTGLRQSGKSTFLQHEKGLAGRRYVSLDDFAQLAAARSDPEGFVRSDEPLIIDEAQKCPELLPAIKREVDRARRPGWFLLSGSANFALLRGIGESLAGRALYLTLHPFSRRELHAQLGTRPFIRRVFEDGAPQRWSPARRWRRAMSSLAGCRRCAWGRSGAPPCGSRDMNRPTSNAMSGS